MKKLAVPFAAAAAIVAVVLVVVLGGGSGSDEGSGALPRDPMTGKTEFDIPVQDPSLVAEGEVLFRANCAQCHGDDLRGTAVGPSFHSVIYNPDHHGDGAFYVAALAGVRAHHWGFGNMPPVAGITEEDVARIVAFIRESQRTGGFETYPPP